ncbi:PTS sugar transporter subunit IIA [Pelosinus fermentans]|uniref:PTS sugar transporter subunit IIA n=1 Tax=Pelosinus fermentans TaxID=365349 RepID=UPI003AF31D48
MIGLVNLIICTHGKFSEELVKASEMISGKQENLKYVTFELGESTDGLVEKYKKAIKELDNKDETLFIVDLFGGSPYNAASRIVADNERLDIVAGVNLPMMLEIYMSRNELCLSELVDVAIHAGRDSVKSFKTNFDNNVEEEL